MAAPQSALLPIDRFSSGPEPQALVTGGAGFLGSHLCERLLEAEWNVICLDNFLTGNRNNVRHLGDHPRFTLIEHDVTRPILGGIRPIAVFHLASAASPPAYLAAPIETLATASLGTYNVLETARAAGAVFLLASTSEVYGDPEVHPQSEGYRGNVSPTGPRSVYDEGKRYAEALTMAYHRALGLDTRIVRIFNTYGPRLAPTDGRAISNFVLQALRGEPLTVHGDGSQTRSFCYVADLIEGLLATVAHGDADPLNLGNPDERSMLDVARLVIEMTGSSSSIEFSALPEDDPRTRCPDTSRARSLIGWIPRFSLEEGLSSTIEWFRTALDVGEPTPSASMAALSLLPALSASVGEMKP